MRIGRRAGATAAALALALTAFWLGQAAAQRGKSRAAIAGVCGVGCVLTDDGALWQFLPGKTWMTIDEAFRQDGRETHILPLPVAVKDIRFMESWGFLVTEDGEVWQYDLETNRWQNIGPP